MADVSSGAEKVSVSESNLVDRLGQLLRAGLPFNPFSFDGIQAENLNRLKQAMDKNEWTDNRFITLEQARLSGFPVAKNAVKVSVVQRSATSLKPVQMVNASQVRNFPSLDEMAKMSGSAIAAFVASGHTIAPVVEVEAGALSITPALTKSLDLKQDVAPPLSKQQGLKAKDSPLKPGSAKVAEQDGKYADPGSAQSTSNQVKNKGTATGFAVIAPYYLNGLHNYQGIELAKALNRTIEQERLRDDRDAVSRLLAIETEGKRFGLAVVTVAELEADIDWKVNPAEPVGLQAGALVRDATGNYRPAAGGKPVLIDQHGELALKSKDELAYKAAMELAVSKGWTTISLKGTEAMMSKAWLEAKMMNLEVVDYLPNDKDKAAYAARIALASEEQKAMASAEVVEPEPEFVVSVAAPVEVAASAAKDGEPFVPKSVASKGRFIGQVLEVRGNYFSQNVGKGGVIWHRNDGVVPDKIPLGHSVDVSYGPGPTPSIVDLTPVKAKTVER